MAAAWCGHATLAAQNPASRPGRTKLCFVHEDTATQVEPGNTRRQLRTSSRGPGAPGFPFPAALAPAAVEDRRPRRLPLTIAIFGAGLLLLPVAATLAQPAVGTNPNPPLASQRATDEIASAVEADITISQPPPTTSRPAKLIQDRRVKRWMKAFAWATILLLILAFGAIALVVFSRRFKDYLIRPERKPTEYVDVWQLHKLPPDADASEAKPPGGDGDE